MMTIKLIDVFPLPGIYIITAVIILIAMELGCGMAITDADEPKKRIKRP